MEFKIKPLVKGTLSFAVPPLRTTHHGATFGTGSSAFCYSVFLRHFSYISQFTNGKVPRVVAEFGPGSSIGMGLAALIAGAELYYGLDIEDHTDSARNLLIFDDLVDLFRRRAPVPSHGLHETTFPPPLKWEFPSGLKNPSTLIRPQTYRIAARPTYRAGPENSSRLRCRGPQRTLFQ